MCQSWVGSQALIGVESWLVCNCWLVLWSIDKFLYSVFIQSILLRLCCINWLAGPTWNEKRLIFNLNHIVFALHNTLIILRSFDFRNFKLLWNIAFCCVLGLVSVLIYAQGRTLVAHSLLFFLYKIGVCFLHRRVITYKFLASPLIIVCLLRCINTLVQWLSLHQGTLLINFALI
jgi:hypothetical protein